MKSMRHTAIIAAILCGTTAAADVTAQQVWDNWSDQIAKYGDGFTTGDETTSGDTLTVSDVKIEMSDGEATMTAQMGDIALTENGDGTVSITMAESYPLIINFTPDADNPGTVTINVEQEALVLTVSGDPEAMVYNVAADRYAFDVVSIDGRDEIKLEAATIALLDIAGTYSVSEDTLTRIAYEFAMGALDVDILFGRTGDKDTVAATLDLADMSMFANIAAPIDMDLDADQPPFSDGLAITGGYTFGALALDFDVDVDNEAAAGSASVDSGTLDFAFDFDGAKYITDSNNVSVSILTNGDYPFPIEASMAKYGFDFQVPLSQGEGPRDARMAFNFVDLTVNDGLWDLFDPQAILPRDPITLAAGIDAQVTPFFDFLDPAQQEAAMLSEIPGEIDSAEITEFVIKAAGAEITGDGAFTFDNSDLQTFDGFPRPEGQISFAVNGLNGLIDNLIQMGIIPEDQAMMPRLMMGMFTTPVGDDMLTSTIEVNAEGHVLANGQRLR